MRLSAVTVTQPPLAWGFYTGRLHTWDFTLKEPCHVQREGKGLLIFVQISGHNFIFGDLTSLLESAACIRGCLTSSENALCIPSSSRGWLVSRKVGMSRNSGGVILYHFSVDGQIGPAASLAWLRPIRETLTSQTDKPAAHASHPPRQVTQVRRR